MNNYTYDDYDYYDWLDEQDRLYDQERATEEYIARLEEDIAKLEKALDKACERLTSNTRLMVRVQINKWQSTYRELTKEEWKELFLKEVQEDASNNL